MKSRPVERAAVLLSLQAAMLGDVFPALRAITVEWSDTFVKFWAYVDGPLTEEDAESLSCISTEVIADFWEDVEIEYEAVRLDYPTKITNERLFVYHRREYHEFWEEQ